MVAAEPERPVKCPICKRSTYWEGNSFRPFCGKRCSLIDLGRWADNEYAIEGTESPVDGGEREEE